MSITVGSTVTTMRFYYNATGTPIAFKYNGTLYYYLTNLQGDVVAIANDLGICATYTYDAWGRIVDTFSMSNLSETLLNVNPLRYRGYIYDNETGFYYLQSRYYDPGVGRFINGDGQLNGGLLGNNLYAYCENNPVNYIDPYGEFAISTVIVLAIVGMAIGFGATAYVDYADDGEVFNGSISAEGYVANTLVCGLFGAFTGGVGSSTFTLSVPTFQFVQTTIGTVELIAVGAATISVNGLIVAGAGVLGIATVGSIMYSKPDSGRIRYSDGTGIDPDTGKPVEDKDRAREIYRSLTDQAKKKNWRTWMKGKGWILSHLDK